MEEWGFLPVRSLTFSASTVGFFLETDLLGRCGASTLIMPSSGAVQMARLGTRG